ncbi:hypothetical protein NY536_18980, partial [Enterobacter hormaechei]|nr:hypothetical protein [Enterobacter hormaechei]
MLVEAFEADPGEGGTTVDVVGQALQLLEAPGVREQLDELGELHQSSGLLVRRVHPDHHIAGR